MKFKNIEIVTPTDGIDSLGCIYCSHESKNNILARYEYFFITPNGKLAAYFKSQKPFSVEYLSNKNKYIFAVFHTFGNGKKVDIVRVERANKHVIVNSYDDIELGVEDGTLAVKNDDKWGFIDEAGKEIIKCQYEKYYSFNLGLAVVYKNNKWGIINKKNETVVPFAYKNIKLYKDTTDKKKSHKYFDEYPSGGFYRIKKDDKFGYVSEQGVVLKQPVYQWADRYIGKYCVVEYDKLTQEKWAILDNRAKCIFKSYYRIFNLGNGMFLVSNDMYNYALVKIKENSVLGL